MNEMKKRRLHTHLFREDLTEIGYSWRGRAGVNIMRYDGRSAYTWVNYGERNHSVSAQTHNH
jgi:hypothetical protein